MKIRSILPRIIAILLGVIFVVSGFSKMLNVQSFIGYITGLRIFNKFFMFGFFIPAFEVGVGLLLIGMMHTRRVALIVAASLIGFTFIYLFGYFTSGITDCGCFGQLALSKMPPGLIVVRNIILFLMATYLFLRPVPVPRYQDGFWVNAGIAFVVATILVLSGITSVKPFVHGGDSLAGQPVAETPLAPYLGTLSPDSTYAVFALHTTCEYCLNSVENVKAYARTHTVDRIIGLTFDSPASIRRYDKMVDPDFHTRHINRAEFERFAPDVPRLFIIRKNRIIDELFFPITAPYVFWRSHSEMKPAGMP